MPAAAEPVTFPLLPGAVSPDRPELPRRLRVLMVLKRPSGNGGMQQQARRVALHMRRLGVAVSLVSQADSRPLPRFGWARRLPVRFLLARGQYHFAMELYRHLLRNAAAYDVVHVHGLALETFAALAAAVRTGKPLVVKPSSAGKGTKLDRFGRITRALPFLKSLVWRRIGAWISISEQATTDLRRLGVPDHRILRIPNGVDTEQFRPLTGSERSAARAELGLVSESVVLCTAARLYPNKRVDLLIRQFAALAGDYPEARLWVMGTGEMLAELQALAGELGVAERVRFWGHLSPAQVVRKLQCADLFALLSRWEGLSNALLEAMACGLTPIVTDVGGMGDAVRHEVSGFLVGVDDEAALADGLRALFADPELRRRMADAAVRTVRERYSLDRTVRSLLAAYQDAQPNGRQSGGIRR